MAKCRNIHSSFWTDSKITDDFTPEDRYLYLWCLTNPRTNLCGCYEVSVKQIAAETGYTPGVVRWHLERLEERYEVLRYDGETRELLLLNWHRYHWTTSRKLEKRVRREICGIHNQEFRAYLATRYREHYHH